MSSSSPTILVAVPLFEGWQHVGEALHSIKSQTYRNFRVLISVDGNDQRSYDICKPFLSDSRFEIVLQEMHLGWAGNVNWLASQLREDFFCYWQHDDHCDPDYFTILVKHASRHPEAASIYCDMQRFGWVNDVERHDSVTGFALERVLAQARRANPVVIRCLIRSDAMRAALPVSLASVWTVALARAGELHRVPQILYFRRMRQDSVGVKMLSRSDDEMLSATLEFGLGVVKHAHSLVEPEEHGRLLAMIAHQITVLQSRGKYQIDFSSREPAAKAQFVTLFLDAATERFGLHSTTKTEAWRWLDQKEFWDKKQRAWQTRPE